MLLNLKEKAGALCLNLVDKQITFKRRYKYPKTVANSSVRRDCFSMELTHFTLLFVFFDGNLAPFIKPST